MYKIVMTRQALKDAKVIERTAMKSKVAALLIIIRDNPFQTPPPYEKLRGEEQTYSRRINIQHRLVYEVFPSKEIIKIIRMWSHYE